MRIARFVFILVGITALLPLRLNAQPAVPGYQVTEYASVSDPMGLDFDSSGFLYAGRDNFGSGGDFGDPVRLHQNHRT